MTSNSLAHTALTTSPPCLMGHLLSLILSQFHWDWGVQTSHQPLPSLEVGKLALKTLPGLSHGCSFPAWKISVAISPLQRCLPCLRTENQGYLLFSHSVIFTWSFLMFLLVCFCLTSLTGYNSMKSCLFYFLWHPNSPAYSRCLIAACCMLSCFSRVRFCATLWTVAPQASLSMGFPGKNTGVGCYFFLQGTFLTQGLNLRILSLLHWQPGSLPLVPPEKPKKQQYFWVVFWVVAEAWPTPCLCHTHTNTIKGYHTFRV